MKEIFSIPIAQAGVITDAKPISAVLLSALQFLLSTIVVLGIIVLVISGILYLTAAGNEDRLALAKRAAIGAVVGVALALGAMMVIRTLGSLFE